MTDDPWKAEAMGHIRALLSHSVLWADWCRKRNDAQAFLTRTEAIPPASFQERVKPWMLECFGPVIPFDKVERGDRFLEEVLELLQSGGYDPVRVLALRDYVWSRPVGEPSQEVGGVMVTLAAYCVAHDLDMDAAAETELARISTPEVIVKIRAKQAAKPTGSALPQYVAIPPTQAVEGGDESTWRSRFEGFVRQRDDYEPADLECDESGNYLRFTTQGAWLGYQLGKWENQCDAAEIARLQSQQASIWDGALEEAAQLIENGVETDSNVEGKHLGKRRDGNLAGLVYARAIRALKQGEG